MKLEVGMYVRNERGIAKYLGLGKDVLTNNESNQFKHYAMQHLFDEPIFDVGHDWGDTLSEEEFRNIDRYIIGEPSESIIDLIQVGDYVNGYKVQIITDKIEKYLGYKLGACYVRLETFGIRDIVTKEQFNNVRYEVE